MKSSTTYGIHTNCVHAGKGNNDPYGAINEPLYMTSNYALPTDGTPVDWSGTSTNIYARNRNINQMILQDKLCVIEGAEDCVVLGSGVSALAGVFVTFLRSGDHVVCSKVCYSATDILFTSLLPEKYGIQVTRVDSTNLEEVRAAIRENTKLVHVESPGNPTTYISDVASIATLAKQAGALLSVDSTMASPLYFKPLQLGADLVIHSMTKYINGHGDALGGCVLGRRDLIERIKQEAMVNFGGILSPFNAWLICRGLVTFPLRMRHHSETAMQVAEFLEGHKTVRFVAYPGLKSHPQHDLAVKQMYGGYSGMICFGIHGEPDRQIRFLDSLKLITHAVSLGDSESLIVYTGPESPKMKYYPALLHEGFYRFSIGLEDAEDIIADLESALKNIA